MKRKTPFAFILSMSLILSLVGCEMLDVIKNPTASFIPSETEIAPGEAVEFTNTSEESDIYEWSFGDGEDSREISPTHVFETAGTYNVTLSAIVHSKTSVATATIEVLQSTTDLELFVYLKDTEIPVVSCYIDLFTSSDDWTNYVNAVYEGQTDSEGHIIVTDLSPIIYYIDAYKESGSEFLVNWYTAIQTPALTPNTTNSYNIFVEDYYAVNQKSTGAQKPMRVVKIEPAF